MVNPANTAGVNCNSLAFNNKDIHRLDKLDRITSGNWPLTVRLREQEEAERTEDQITFSIQET